MRTPRSFSMSTRAPRRATTVKMPGTWTVTTRSPTRIVSSGTAAELAGGAAGLQGDVASPGPRRENAPMLVEAHRFAGLFSLVVRVYGGYKLIQWTGGGEARYARHHRRSAEGAYRLATRLEGLPIKVCQFLGSRADILPAEYVEVLSALQDRVPPRPFAQLRPYVEGELGSPLGDVFTEFDPVPLASASLAQVHRARLRDGREVAVKIQYPEIADLVAIDLENFAFLLGVLARLEPNLDLRVVLEEVQKYVPLELDFRHEATNAERMAEHLAARADVL